MIVKVRVFLGQIIMGILIMPSKKQKLPLEIIEEKFGKERPLKSDVKIKAYFNSKGYKSLSRLIEAK
jgi:hypothetical protein